MQNTQDGSHAAVSSTKDERRQNSRIPLLPPSQITALLAIWPRTAPEGNSAINVVHTANEAGLKASDLFCFLPKLEEAGYFSRVSRGIYTRGSTTQFKCGRGRSKATEITPLPTRFPNLHLIVGQTYDLREIVAEIGGERTLGVVAVLEPAILQPSQNGDNHPQRGNANTEVVMAMELTLPPLQKVGGGGSLETEIALRHDHLMNLGAFRARLQAMLRMVDAYEEETKQDIHALEVAQKVIARPLPGSMRNQSF